MRRRNSSISECCLHTTEVFESSRRLRFNPPATRAQVVPGCQLRQPLLLVGHLLVDALSVLLQGELLLLELLLKLAAGQVSLPAALLLLLVLQLPPQLVALSSAALGALLVRVQQLGLVERAQLLQLLLVLGDQLLDVGLQAWPAEGSRG